VIYSGEPEVSLTQAEVASLTDDQLADLLRFLRESTLVAEAERDKRAIRAGEAACTCHGHDGWPYLHEVDDNCPQHGKERGP
jgi:hypothetical protein